MVRIVDSDSKVCWLPPEKENTGLLCLFTILLPTLPEYSVCSTGEKQKGKGTGTWHRYQGPQKNKQWTEQSKPIASIPVYSDHQWLTALSSPLLQAIKYCSSKVSRGHYGSNHFGKWCLKRARISSLTYFKFLTESVIAIHV